MGGIIRKDDKLIIGAFVLAFAVMAAIAYQQKQLNERLGEAYPFTKYFP